MPQMHTLVLGGQSYTISDPNAARMDNTTVGDAAWSGKTIIDRLCPAFRVEKPMVICDPVEGYPLEVITRVPAENPVTQLTLRRTGKNLWDFKNGISQCRGISGTSGEDVIRYGCIVTLPPGTYTVSAQVNAGTNYIYFNPINLETLVMGNLTYFITNTGATTVKVDLQEGYGLFFYNANLSDLKTTQKIFLENVDIQIQRGTVATPYQSFGEEKTVLFSAPFSGDYRWEPVIAGAGENHIFSSTGTTCVTGRLDLASLLEKGGLLNV